MKIAFLLPGPFAVGSPGNGVRVQAEKQADALEALGHPVARLDPWQRYDVADFDVVQFFLGGTHQYSVEHDARRRYKMLVFAPTIDSQESNARYRFAAKLGRILPKVFTTPSLHAAQANGSDLVIVRSTEEQGRLVQGLGTNPNKVSIVLNGVTPPEPADPQIARRELDLPEEFALHVSAYTQGRKNVARLIKAIGPTGIPLVIAGHAMEGPDKSALIDAARPFPQIRFFGWLSHETLESLYAACKIFCLPSLFEGTGLVALEAAVHGARVVITQNGGPPDYFLDLAEYVDPSSVASIRAAIMRAWEAPDSDKLKTHVLNNLTWENSARSLVAAYQKHRRA
ncbi:MAG: glycosyltransferase family 4 protein [Phycisphaeraceae bacterium]